MNLKDNLKEEIERCEILLGLYKEIPTGGFGVSGITSALKRAKAANDKDDIQLMVVALKELEEME